MELAIAQGLPPDVQAVADRFLLPPTDPASPYHGPAASSSVVAAAVLAASASTCVEGWLSRRGGAGFRYSIPCTGDYEADLAKAITAGDSLWQKMVDFMGPPILTPTPDGDAINVYLAEQTCPVQGPSCRTMTPGNARTFVNAPWQGGPGSRRSSGHIILARTSIADDELLRSHFAHEFFHVLEYSHNVDAMFIAGGSHWILEASTTWASTYFATPGARRLIYEPLFVRSFQEIDAPLNEPFRGSTSFGYHAFIWPYFIEQERGAGVIATMWDRFVDQPANVIDDRIFSVMPFAGHFADFAVRNLNDTFHGTPPPLGERYDQADPSFPVGFRPGDDKSWPEENLELTGTSETKYSYGVEVLPLSAQYFSFTHAADVEAVTFDFSELDPAGLLDIDFVHDGGDPWKRVSVEPPFGLVKFCFDNTDEDWLRTHLVISNHDMRATGTGDFEVRAHRECGPGNGTVTVTRVKDGTYTSARGNPVEVHMRDQATITFELVQDEYSSDQWATQASSITWTYSLSAVETGDECVSTETAEGGGTYSGAGGPTLTFGWATDGTLFGSTIDETSYMITVTPPELQMDDGDPRGWYRGHSDICGEIKFDTQWPYTVLALADGEIPESDTLTGSDQRTIQDQLNGDGLPITQTITWNIRLE